MKDEIKEIDRVFRIIGNAYYHGNITFTEKEELDNNLNFLIDSNVCAQKTNKLRDLKIKDLSKRINNAIVELDTLRMYIKSLAPSNLNVINNQIDKVEKALSGVKKLKEGDNE